MTHDAGMPHRERAGTHDGGVVAGCAHHALARCREHTLDGGDQLELPHRADRSGPIQVPFRSGVLPVPDRGRERRGWLQPVWRYRPAALAAGRWG